jgi:hypothetical protein
MDLQPWMGQVGIAGASVGLLYLAMRAFIASVSSRVDQVRTDHAEEMARVTKQHERELQDMRERAQAWEATANRREAALSEALAQNARLQATGDTTVQLLRALRQTAVDRRELET